MDALIHNPNETAASEHAYFPRDKGHDTAGNDQIAKWVFEYLVSGQYLPSPKSDNQRHASIHHEKRFNIGIVSPQ